ncbi:hypothetical protein DVH24_031413 [Malus domestica]|uniref:Uncharacterized protein n=1 Tax=Malus domestica TaxID=3750 RepID=A0A498HE70_MALDO|nr:hypothetical protein DVH24_031413 [Malus domestica]
MLYGIECWMVKHQDVHKMSVVEMRILRWMCGHTRNGKIKNEDIRGKLKVAKIEEKMKRNLLRLRAKGVEEDLGRLGLFGSNGRHDTKPSAAAF